MNRKKVLYFPPEYSVYSYTKKHEHLLLYSVRSDLPDQPERFQIGEPYL